eukprot:4695138-Pyramimonas_sp.AAC.1
MAISNYDGTSAFASTYRRLLRALAGAQLALEDVMHGLGSIEHSSLTIEAFDGSATMRSTT